MLNKSTILIVDNEKINECRPITGEYFFYLEVFDRPATTFGVFFLITDKAYYKTDRSLLGRNVVCQLT